MPTPLAARQILDREFLELRCRMLDLAAGLDRLERAEGSVADDPRLAKLQTALDILRQKHGNRAEEIQLLFSREYKKEWRVECGV